jgi:hypothetical protein
MSDRCAEFGQMDKSSACAREERGNPLPAVRVAADSPVQMGKGIHALYRLFRSGAGPSGHG